MKTKVVTRAESKSVVLAISFWNLEPELVGLSLSVLSPLLERIKSSIRKERIELVLKNKLAREGLRTFARVSTQ